MDVCYSKHSHLIPTTDKKINLMILQKQSKSRKMQFTRNMVIINNKNMKNSKPEKSLKCRSVISVHYRRIADDSVYSPFHRWTLKHPPLYPSHMPTNKT